MKTVIIRIIGNDLPGLHKDTQNYDHLLYIIKNETRFPNVKKIWILNRIVSQKKRNKYLKIFQQYKIEFVDIPFSRKEFSKLGKLPRVNIQEMDKELMQTNFPNKNTMVYDLMRSLYSFNLYVVNNNGSRNFAIEYAKKHGYAWSFVFDGSSFLTDRQWNEVSEVLKTAPDNVKYLILPQLRINNLEEAKDEELLDSLIREEPQIAFRNSASLSFNPLLPYGSSPKAELLRVLKVPGKWRRWKDAKTIYNIGDREPTKKEEEEEEEKHQVVASVLRLPTGETSSVSKSMNKTYWRRQYGIYRLCESVEAKKK
jgi:hypothetical protein